MLRCDWLRSWSIYLSGQHRLDVGGVDVQAALEGLGIEAGDGLGKDLLQGLAEGLLGRKAKTYMNISNIGIRISIYANMKCLFQLRVT